MDLPDVKAPESGGKMFLKIKDGESIRGVFVGKFHHFYSKWVNGKSLPCDESDTDGKVRFRCNFVMLDPQTNELTSKVWEFPYSVFEMLKGINEEYSLEKTKVKITRNGVGTDTTYTIMPLLTTKDTLSAKQLDAINAIPLNPLEKKGSPASSAEQMEHQGDGPEIPF